MATPEMTIEERTMTEIERARWRPVLDAIRHNGQVFGVEAFGRSALSEQAVRRLIDAGRACRVEGRRGDYGAVAFFDPAAAGEYAAEILGTGSVTECHTITAWSVQGLQAAHIGEMRGPDWTRGVDLSRSRRT